MSLKDYFEEGAGNSEIESKPPHIRQAINEALYIMECFGIPLDGTPRRIERMALCFLALANVKSGMDWKSAKDQTQGVSMRTRDIIRYINESLYDNLSPSSYDDIRRKDLNSLLLGGIVVQTNPRAATNDGTRGYAISRDYGDIIREFGVPSWEEEVEKFMVGNVTLSSKYAGSREIEKTIVVLPNKEKIMLSSGVHNTLQQSAIEEFLPRFGKGAEVLYLGDASRRILVYEKEKLQQLNFFELSHGNLPDIVAYSQTENWLWLIEAVHSSGPISRDRLLRLKELTRECKAEIIYVTAFTDMKTFRRHAANIAWETEVWVAEFPDHLIHFNGDKFIGPHKSN